MQLSLYQHLYIAALGNSAICTGIAKDYELTAWYGEHRTGVRREEIIARQADMYARECEKYIQRMER